MTSKTGSEIVERERDMDAAFQQGTITPAQLVTDAETIGALQGRLRTIHLAAHLETRSVLSLQQITTYDVFRGYANGAVPPSRGHHMQPG